MKRRLAIGVFGATGALASFAQSAPLTLDQIDQLQSRLDCQDQCEHGRVALLQQCLSACPAMQSTWDKNGDGALTIADEHLALREFYDEGTGDYVCYQGPIVKHIEECEACTVSHTAAECSDADGDGIPAWMEAVIGTSPAVANVLCSSAGDCYNAALSQTCTYYPQANRSLCGPRACAATNNCTAFHLELVEKNDVDVVVRVVYDFLPVDPTVLDLHIRFNNEYLVLADARALSATLDAGKSIEVRQPIAGTLRLMVLGGDSSMPLEAGPVAELVFRRIGGTQGSIWFSTGDTDQSMAVAPDPGQAKTALKTDNLWGAAVNASVDRQRLVFHYSFDNQTAPLAANSAQSGAELCGLLASCRGLGTADPQRVKQTNQLNTLQQGVVQGQLLASSVSGNGLALDGKSNHLELPVSVNEPTTTGGLFQSSDQSFSMNTWLLHDSAATGSAEVIFSHNNGDSEATRFGLAAVPSSLVGHFDLVLFQGDLGNTGVSIQTVSAALGDRQWTHVAFNVDASNSTVSVFVDGKSVAKNIALASTPATFCPQLNPSNVRGLGIKKMGGEPQPGQLPEVITFATSRNNLYGIEQMDPNGLGQLTLLRSVDSSAMDPDYSPGADKLVYASTVSGNSEIWIANADGSNPIQISQGFGDTARGVFARRPRWAPDGSGILFESNAYSFDYDDNAWAQAYQLYFVAYDVATSAVAIPAPANGSPALTVLDYDAAVRGNSISFYRASTGYDNHTNVQWLRGRYTDGANSFLGELLVTTSDKNFDNDVITRYAIRAESAGSARVAATTPTQIAPFGGQAKDRPMVLLAARSVTKAGQPTVERRLLAEQQVSYAPASDFYHSVAAGGASTCPAGQSVFTTTVFYNPSAAPDPYCWDIDGNFEGDVATEDVNGDGTVDTTDCSAYDVSELLLNVGSVGTALAQNANGKTVVVAGAWLTAHSKSFDVRTVYSTQRTDISLRVTSPLNTTSIPAGTELGRFEMCGNSSQLALQTRLVTQQLYLQDGATATPTAFAVDAATSEVLAAAFSPNADRLVLSVIRHARPELLRTKGLAGATDADTISNAPARVEGLSWATRDKYFACNWVGAMRNPSDGRYAYPFKGALDELRFFNYVRTPDAIQSEAERGAELLAKNGITGVGIGTQQICETHATCPTYYLCLPSGSGATKTCQIQTCDPNAANACTEGQCRSVPMSLATAGSHACVVECAADSQCFEKECLNGPCRFCADNACKECKPTVQQLGSSITLRYIEGCPDRNSFSCEAGTCASECYTFENGQSRFLCNSATQYCKQGRCAMLDWNWADFGLSTLSGLGEARYDLPQVPATIAQPTIYPIKIEAFGVSDYGHPPELLVEGKFEPEFGPRWFDIGRIQVRNIDLARAVKNPYYLLAPLPISQIRVRLVSPPYANFNKASTGLMGRDKDFWLPASPDDTDSAFRRHYGSRANLGYPAALTGQEVLRAANARFPADYLWDPSSENTAAQRYLIPGQPAVVVTNITVNGDSIANPTNRMCSYEGTTDPAGHIGGGPRFVFYGDASLELSHQRSVFYPIVATTALLSGSTSPYVLNCNYANPKNELDVAAIVATVPTITQSLLMNPAVVENGNGCTIQEQSGASGGTTVSRPCYEWTGGGVTIDYLATSSETMYRTLEIEGLRSFGWDGNP